MEATDTKNPIHRAIDAIKRKIEWNEKSLEKFRAEVGADVSYAISWCGNFLVADQENKVLRPLRDACLRDDTTEARAVEFLRECADELESTLLTHTPDVRSTSWLSNAVGLAQHEARREMLKFLKCRIREIASEPASA